MSIITPKISPGKGRWPKDDAKRGRRKALLEAGEAHKKASARKHGSQGAASPVRHIDPAEYKSDGE